MGDADLMGTARGIVTRWLAAGGPDRETLFAELPGIIAAALQAQRLELDRNVTELAELRKRVACCEQCAQSVIDPACIFCGHEPDTTKGGEHG